MKDLNKNAKKNFAKPDGRDIEFSEELADTNDKVAQQRSKAADERAKNQ